MTLRNTLRRWLGVPTEAENVVAIRGNCEYTGQHHFEARFDETPSMTISAADIIAFQGSNKTEAKQAKGSSWVNTITEYVPQVSLDHQIKLVEAHKKKLYLGDACRYCGKFVRYEREP